MTFLGMHLKFPAARGFAIATVVTLVASIVYSFIMSLGVISLKSVIIGVTFAFGGSFAAVSGALPSEYGVKAYIVTVLYGLIATFLMFVATALIGVDIS